MKKAKSSLLGKPMEKKYSTPLTEVVLLDDATESLMLPASPSGSTDEALSRQQSLDRCWGRSMAGNCWEDEWEEEEEGQY